MPFSINDFKAILNGEKFNGPARSNLFEVQIIGGKPSIYLSSPDITIFCKTASVPGLHVKTFEYKKNNFGLSQEMPTDIIHENLDCIFLMDSNHQVLSYFHEWMQQVINYSTQGGPYSEVNGALPYEMGYKDEYSKTLIIKHYSSDNLDSYYQTILRGVYPINMGALTLAWDSSDSIMTLPIKFGYESIEFAAEIRGTPTSQFSRGNGLLGLLNYVGSSTQFIDQLKLPTNIQDALNVYTTINRGVNILKNIFK